MSTDLTLDQIALTLFAAQLAAPGATVSIHGDIGPGDKEIEKAFFFAETFQKVIEKRRQEATGGTTKDRAVAALKRGLDYKTKLYLMGSAVERVAATAQVYAFSAGKAELMHFRQSVEALKTLVAEMDIFYRDVARAEPEYKENLRAEHADHQLDKAVDALLSAWDALFKVKQETIRDPETAQHIFNELTEPVQALKQMQAAWRAARGIG